MISLTGLIKLVILLYVAIGILPILLFGLAVLYMVYSISKDIKKG